MPTKTEQTRASVLSRHCVIGGSARSGTTVLGTLLHSLEGVEYFFEPPVVGHLLSEGMSDAASWKTYETSLFDDLLLGALSGRNLNLNKHDDSCVFKAKPEYEVLQRMSTSHRKPELETRALAATVAYKTPHAVFRFSSIRARYASARIAGIHRDPNDVVNSLLEKRWFSNASLSVNGDWHVAYRGIRDGIKVPFWVDDHTMERWPKMSEIKRAAHYYLASTRALCTSIEKSKVVGLSYEELVDSPHSIVEKLQSAFALSPTHTTQRVISGISRRSKPRRALVAQLGQAQKEIDALTERVHALLK